MNKIKKLITVVLCVSLLLPYNVSAHSGRTDSSGGPGESLIEHQKQPS